MKNELIVGDVLFEAKSPLGTVIHSHEAYWNKIIYEKHPELKFGQEEVKDTIEKPDEIRVSEKDDTIQLFYKKISEYVLVVVVKILNSHGFLVTTYQTKDAKPKGQQLWPK